MNVFMIIVALIHVLWQELFFSWAARAAAAPSPCKQQKIFLQNYSSNIFVRIPQKIKEGIIAIKLERNFTKEEIITLYLNTVPFSDNVYGIRNAAKTFFQKEPDRLNC